MWDYSLRHQETEECCKEQPAFFQSPQCGITLCDMVDRYDRLYWSISPFNPLNVGLLSATLGEYIAHCNKYVAFQSPQCGITLCDNSGDSDDNGFLGPFNPLNVGLLSATSDE